jgi:N-acetylglucosaminyldiphosphoundecaprenol N-acetyl-beta-D-mannosaminyltransferase
VTAKTPTTGNRDQHPSASGPDQSSILADLSARQGRAPGYPLGKYHPIAPDSQVSGTQLIAEPGSALPTTPDKSEIALTNAAGLNESGATALNAQARRELILTLNRQYSGAGIRHRRISQAWRATTSLSLVHLFAICRRTLNVTLSLLLIVCLSPLFLALYLVARRGGEAIRKQTRLGRWGGTFGLYQFEFAQGSFWKKPLFYAMPELFNVLKGEMSFIGPRPVAAQEIPASEREAWKRFDLLPGMINVWWLRQRANIAYASEASIDAEYVETRSFWGDVGIALRALPALAYGQGVSSAPEQVTLLGISMDNLTMAEASDCIAECAQTRTFTQICFVNAECVNIAFRDPEYKRILAASRYVLADGIGVRLAGKLLNQNIRENVNGTDMLPYLCAALEQAGLSLFLLGGRPGIPDAVAAWIAQRYPSLHIAGYRDGYFTPPEAAAITAQIRQSGAQVLLTAMGVPLQEKWIAAHADELSGLTCIGVGGLFDFYSGRIPRAPVWMRELGLEWLFRFAQEPRRMWRRYIYGNIVFLSRLLLEKWKSKDHGETTGRAA